MKVIAFYLPQYYTFPENDEWWGKGFTEWNNVKRATPLFRGHIQPQIPLNNNYYNLADVHTMEKQAELAHQYNVHGFCFYHYWFDGKLLLNLPVENYLHDQDIDLQYCLSWANESWSRTWDGKENHYLIKQNYNEGLDGIQKHYKYLSQFFHDDRYIKHDNKPLFILYKPHLNTNIKKTMDIWNELAIKDGFSGIYWGFQHPSTFASSVINQFDFAIEFEPLYTMREIQGETADMSDIQKIIWGTKHPKWLLNRINHKLFNKPTIYNYDDVWRRILSRDAVFKNTYGGAFCEWDNTPRKGGRGIVYYEATPEKFNRYFQQQLHHINNSVNYNNEYLFINAWNEWGEGAHLEPDEYHKYAYLDVIKQAVE